MFYKYSVYFQEKGFVYGVVFALFGTYFEFLFLTKKIPRVYHQISMSVVAEQEGGISPKG